MTFLRRTFYKVTGLLNWRGRTLWRYFFRLVLILTVLQVGARVALQFAFFGNLLTLSQASIAHFYGLRFDLRLACLVAGVPLLAGSIPWIQRWLHPVTGRILGSKASLWWFWPGLGALVTGLWSLLIYADFGNMAYWQQRLNVGVLYLLQDLETNSKVLWESYPVLLLAASTVVLVIASFALFKRNAGSLASDVASLNSPLMNPIKRTQNVLINLALVSVVIFLIHGRWSQYPLRWSDLVRVGHPPAEQLAINAVQNIVDTLAYRKPQFDRQAAEAAYPTMAPWLGVPPRQNSTSPSPSPSPSAKPLIYPSFRKMPTSFWWFSNPFRVTSPACTGTS
jgi:hypothetical protein